MTIREYISKRTRIALGIAFGGWLFFLVAGVVGTRYLDNPLIVMIGFLVFGGAVIYMALFIKCPRCGFRLGQAGMILVFRRTGAQSVNFCAHCGVSFDEERNPRGA
jgi:hypothetical protein